MKTFKFNLETFLKIRKSKEEIMKMEFACQNGNYERISQELKKTKRQQHENRVANDPTNSISDYVQQGHYLAVLQNRELTLIKELEHCAKDLAKAQENFIQAKKESTALELLEKQQYDDYQLNIRRQRQIEIGEQSNQAWRRRHG